MNVEQAMKVAISQLESGKLKKDSVKRQEEISEKIKSGNAAKKAAKAAAKSA